MAILKLPTDPRTAVWRQLVKTLKADPVLSREVRVWHVWDKAVTSSLPPSPTNPVTIRLSPIPGQQTMYSADSNVGPLVVRIEYDILTYDIDDVLNLWGAIERAIYPNDTARELEIEADFRAAGAETGMWQFTQPAVDPQPGSDGDQQFHCVGQIQIDVIRLLRP